jgi:hypothetical protein
MQLPLVSCEQQATRQGLRSSIEEVNDTANAVIPDGSQFTRRFSTGWDPYEVWRTRICSTPTAVDVGATLLPGTVHRGVVRREINMPTVVGTRRPSASAAFWPTLVLVVILD